MVWPPQGDDSPSFGFKAVCCCEVHGPPVRVLEWQNKSALTAPCGFLGPIGTRYWRTRTWSGSLHSEYFTSCDPDADPLGSGDDVFGGSFTKTLTQETFDPGDGSPVQHFVDCKCEGELTANGDVVDDASSCTNNPQTPNQTCPTGSSTTDTAYTLSGTGECFPVGDVGLGCYCTGEVADTYSVETFFQDNIDACDAQPWDTADMFWAPTSDTFLGSGYSQWLNSGWGGVNTYDPGRFRFHQNHLSPGHEYTFSIEVWRAAYSGTPVTEGDFSLYATIEVVVTADGAGEIHVEATDIPNADGFITMLKYSSMLVTPS